MRKEQNSGVKKILLNSGFYVFSALLVDAIGFFLLPVYLIFLDATEYGKVSIANGFLDVAIIIAVLSLHMAIARFYSDYKNDKDKVAAYFGTILLFVLIISSSFTLICFGVRPVLEKYIFSDIDFYPLIFLVLVSIPFRSLRCIHRFILRAMQQGGELALVNLIIFIMQAGLTFYLIGPVKMGAAGMLLAALIVHVLYTIYIIIDLRIKGVLKFKIRLKMVKESIIYSLPIMPHNLSSYIATLFSRVFLNNYSGIDSVGLYSVASQFGTVVDAIESSSNNAITPWFFDYKNDSSNNNNTIRSLTKIFSIIYGICFLGLGLFSKEIILIITRIEYHEAWRVIPVLSAAYGIKGIYYFYLNVMLYYKKASKLLFIGTITGNLINVVIAFLLTPILGMYGSAIALLVAQLFIATFVYIVSHKYDKDSFKLMTILWPLVFASLFTAIGILPSYLYFNNSLHVVEIMIKCILFVFYVSICLFVSRKEMKLLINSVLKKKKNNISDIKNAVEMHKNEIPNSISESTENDSERNKDILND